MSQRSPAIQRMLNTPTLTKAQEHDLVRAAQRGDLKARNRLVEGNLRHAATFSLTYAGYGMCLEDLCSEACRGLIRATERFDTSRDVTFVTYAVFWMRAYVHTFILQNWTMVRNSSVARTAMFFRLRRELYDAFQVCEGSRDNATELVAKRNGWSINKVREHEEYLRCRDLSMETPVECGRDGGMVTRGDFFASPGPAPDELYERASERDRAEKIVRLILRSASPREREILHLRYLCDPEDSISLADMSERWGVSRERVRQIERALFAKLYAHLTENRSLEGLRKMASLRKALEKAPRRVKPKTNVRGGGKRPQLRVTCSGDGSPLLAANC